MLCSHYKHDCVDLCLNLSLFAIIWRISLKVAVKGSTDHSGVSARDKKIIKIDVG